VHKTLVALAISVTITQGTPLTSCTYEEPQRDPAAEWVACVEAVHRDPNPALGDDAAYQACDRLYGVRTMPEGECLHTTFDDGTGCND
jgi:hypothetical protein